VGWSGYITGLLAHLPTPIILPHALVTGPYAGGIIDLPAVAISLLVTMLLVVGTTESATVNSVLVAVKIAALCLFAALALPVIHMKNFHPFAPLGTPGIIGAGASIFFAYVGFDAVSTASEETKNPQRNIPIGLIGSLVICTVLYLMVAIGAVGAYGAQPLFGLNGEVLSPGSPDLMARCNQVAGTHLPMACSSEALAYVLRQLDQPLAGSLLGLAAGLALPSVILMMIYGQTRIFFVMARDGLLPPILTAVHSRFRTPHVVTWITGISVSIAAAFFPVGELADISNSGTLFAFMVVAIAVLVLRRTEPARHRSFRTPLVWLIAPAAALGCLVLFFFLPQKAQLLFPVWSAIGLAFYFSYGFRHSHVRG
jgi:basic amino acid/polyamine antiporter, APA family